MFSSSDPIDHAYLQLALTALSQPGARYQPTSREVCLQVSLLQKRCYWLKLTSVEIIVACLRGVFSKSGLLTCNSFCLRAVQFQQFTELKVLRDYMTQMLMKALSYITV